MGPLAVALSLLVASPSEIRVTGRVVDASGAGVAGASVTIRALDAFLAAENLLDRRYDVGRTPVRTLGPSRSLRAGVRIHVE